jgi:hypothetical protein
VMLGPKGRETDDLSAAAYGQRQILKAAQMKNKEKKAREEVKENRPKRDLKSELKIKRIAFEARVAPCSGQTEISR